MSLLLALSVAFAQEGPAAVGVAVVRGTVTSGRGGIIPGALVTLPELGLEARTDEAGQFLLEVPAGVHTLWAEADGFAPTALRDQPLSAGVTLEVAFQLEETSVPGADIVVTANASGGVATVLAERREAPVVTDVVGSTQMARSGDSDAAAAVKRVTGLTVVDGKYVYVRGLGDRYAATTLNGAALPSPEPEKRVVPLDLFPTAILDAVTIQKSVSADAPAEFGGGVVQLRTRGLPADSVFSVGLSGAWVGGTTLADGYVADRGPTDWLGFGRRFRAMPASVADSGQALKAAGMFSESGYTPEELEAFGEAFPNHWGFTPRTLPPDMGANLAAGHRWSLGSVDVGVLGAAVYSNAWDLEETTRRVYATNSDDALEVKRITTYTDTQNTVRLGGALVAGLEWGSGGTLLSTTLLNRNSVGDAVTWDVDDPTSTSDTRNYRVDWVEQSMVLEQLRAAGEVGPVEVDAQYTFAFARGDEPDRREWTYNLTDQGYYLSQLGSWNEILYTALHDRTDDVRLDLGLPFTMWGGEGRLDAGMDLLTRTRASSTRRFSYEFRGAEGIDTSLPVGEVLTPENIGATETGDPGWFQVGEVTSTTDDYTAWQRIQAGYLSANLPWHTRFRTIVGARIEAARQAVSTFETFEAETPSVLAELDDLDVLPAANLAVGIGAADTPDRMLVRAGYGRTVSRPEFRELSEVPYYDYQTGRLNFGNPALERARIDNLDLRWEWYPSPTESLSFGGFYKHFDHPIESVVAVSAVSGSVGTFANATSATDLGLEADLRHGLGFVGPALAEAYVAANVAVIASSVDLSDTEGNQTSTERPLQGQSPWVVNLQLGWDHDRTGTSATVLYNAAGPRITEVGTSGIPDTYALPVHRLDLVWAQSLGSDWKLRLKGSNLLDWPVRERTGDQIARESRAGWAASVGLSWSPI